MSLAWDGSGIAQPGGCTIRECLRGYTNDALGLMCERWQLPSTSKENRIRALDRVLDDSLHIREALARQTDCALRLLSLLAEREETTAADALSVPALFTSESNSSALSDIMSWGLVLAAPHNRSGAFSFGELERHGLGVESARHMFMPDRVKHRLPEAPPLTLDIEPAKGLAEPDIVTASGDKATAAFLETLRVVELLAPRMTAANKLHRADLQRAQELTAESGISNEELSLGLAMARWLRCIEDKDGRLTTTDVAILWAEKNYADRIRDLWQAFIHSGDLADLKLFFPQIFDALEQHLPDGWMRRTYHRTLTAQCLRLLQENAWYGVEEFVEAIRRRDRNVLFLEERWRALSSNVHDPSASWKQRMWQAHEQRLFTWIVRSVLLRLGMVDLAGENRYFRLTALGRFALGVGDAPANAGAATGRALILQPDFEIIVYGDRCPADLRRKLDTFCERVRSGHVSTYRVTQESVYRGVRSGTALSKFIKTLEENTLRPIPPNVHDQFLTWQQKLENVSILAKTTLVECQDNKAAEKIAAKIPGSRLVGDRWVLVDKSLDEMPASLKDAALSTLDYSQAVRPCLVQEQGLKLRVPWAKRGLFIRRRLLEAGRIEESADGELTVHLERQKVKTGEDGGLAVALLETLAEEPLAPRFRAALRAWSGENEPAVAATVTVIRFSDAETAEAVMELPELAGEIEGRLGLFAIVVRKGRLTTLKKKLKEHGIQVERNGGVADTTPPEDWAAAWLAERHAAEEEPAAPLRKSKDRQGAYQGVQLPSYSPRILCEILEDAISRRKPVLLAYQSVYSDCPGVRRVNPVSVDIAAATPSVSGFCHQHGGSRTFKLARIQGIRILEDEEF